MRIVEIERKCICMVFERCEELYHKRERKLKGGYDGVARVLSTCACKGKKHRGLG